jgi:hypothetical protein
MNIKRVTTYSALALATSLIFAGCAPVAELDTASPESSASAPATSDATTPPESTETAGASETNEPAASTKTSSASETEALLLYLIEEEKLAHDVYQAMYDIWGARVFGNILKSEETHQGQVLTLLASRNIDDPRSATAGVFVNKDLQALYDDLIAKGSKSAVDAYEVGVMIEELDIKDISAQLATATDADVILTLEKLRSGSENHLRAFNNQI